MLQTVYRANGSRAIESSCVISTQVAWLPKVYLASKHHANDSEMGQPGFRTQKEMLRVHAATENRNNEVNNKI
jgi:hypothetical protein